MVDFGLKLEDNKVSDWNEYYIQYEKLKLILKKCENAIKTYNELVQCRPETAATIVEKYERGDDITTGNTTGTGTDIGFGDNQVSVQVPTSFLAKTHLENLQEVDDNISECRTVSSCGSLQQLGTDNAVFDKKNNDTKTKQTTTKTATRTSTLLENPLRLPVASMPDYGATSSGNIKDSVSSDLFSMGSLRSDNENIISRALKRASSNVTDYYSSRYEKKLYSALTLITKYEKEFDNLLQYNITLINTFYSQKVHEIHDQLLYLRESVQPTGTKTLDTTTTLTSTGSADASTPTRTTKNAAQILSTSSSLSDSEPTPLITSRKKGMTSASPIFLVKKIASSFAAHHQQSRIKRTSYGGGDKDLNPLLSSTDTVDADDVDNTISMDAETLRKIQIAESVQRSLVDLYRTSKLLQNFVIINYTGIVKIVKKFDKTVQSTKKGLYKNDTLSSNICNDGRDVQEIVARMERLYAIWFCDNDINAAKAQILIKRSDGLEMDWSQLRLGYRMGMCTVLALWVFWDCVWGLVTQGQTTIGSRTAFPVFRACGGLLQLQWCWGISVWVWTRYRVNYIFLFDFDPTIVGSPLSIFNNAVDNTLVLLTCTLLYYKAGVHDIPGNFPPGVFALLVVLYTIVQLIFPLKIRIPMWKSIYKVITSPLHSPSFFQGYVGDIFTSMVKVFQDIVWTIFFIGTGDWTLHEENYDELSEQQQLHLWSKTSWYKQILIPIITLIPLVIRFNQCLRRYADTRNRVPHLPNASKYALSQLVSLFGAFHPLYMKAQTENEIYQRFWMVLFVTSSLYSFSWDVFMDWGLGDRHYGFLAKSLMYQKRGIYYVIIAIDLVLRFAWVLTLIPPSSGAKFALPAYLSLVSMMLELFRRTLWGFLRLEHEHRSNASGYRRVGFVPLHFATGHNHGYKKEVSRSGFAVLAEVLLFASIVICAAIVSVVAAQQASEQHSEF